MQKSSVIHCYADLIPSSSWGQNNGVGVSESLGGLLSIQSKQWKVLPTHPIWILTCILCFLTRGACFTAGFPDSVTCGRAEPTGGCCARWYPAPLTAECQPACIVYRNLEGGKAVYSARTYPLPHPHPQHYLVDNLFRQASMPWGELWLWGPRSSLDPSFPGGEGDVHMELFWHCPSWLACVNLLG